MASHPLAPPQAVIGLYIHVPFCRTRCPYCDFVRQPVEGPVPSAYLSALRDEIKARPLAMLGGLLAKPAFRAVAKMLDYREYGGAALLGVNGIVIIGHGRSEALAVENAVRVAIDANVGGLIPEIRQDIKNASHVLGSVPPSDQVDRTDQADQVDRAE